MCDYWVHVVESLRFVAGVLSALAAFCGLAVLPLLNEHDIRPETGYIVWGICAALIVLCALSLVFGPTGEIVAGWCAP